MAKLHELLAVDGDAEGRVKRLQEETKKNLAGKPHLFSGKSRKLTMFSRSEENAAEIQALEAKDSVSVPLPSTVPETLNYLGVQVANYFDIALQKESTNQEATADVIVDGVVIVKDAPVTFLLGMESRLKDFRAVLNEVPTLDATKTWTPDENTRAFAFRSNPTTTLKTSTETEFKTIAPATDKHPAQVVQDKVVKNVGRYDEQEWSGNITAADKARLLERNDKLIKAVKQARMRANETVVQDVKAGDAMFGFILGNWYNRDKANTEATV